MAAYNSPTGIPYNTIALDTLEVRNPQWTRRSSTLSEFGSEQLEFVKLSQLTGNVTYGQKAEDVIQLLHSKYPDKVCISRPVHLQLSCCAAAFCDQKPHVGNVDAAAERHFESCSTQPQPTT